MFKSMAREWLPPALIRWGRQIRGGGIRFESGFPTWEAASARCSGYDAENILAKVLDATLKVKEGKAAFERDSVLFEEFEYAWPVLAGLMWAAARSGGKLNVLDFGGALGSSYFQGGKFLQSLPHVNWNVVEQAHYVEAGQKYIQDERLRFYKTIEQCLSQNRPNVILLSSVLQYLPDPGSVLHDLMQVKGETIIVDRTIINHGSCDRVYIQHVPTSIYSASYPCRSLSESVLFATLEQDYLVCGEFASLNFPALASISSDFKGYIFTRKNNL